MTQTEEQTARCCAALYGHPLVSRLLQGSFHPGGTSLTAELADLAHVTEESQVLDLGAGSGTSAVFLARTRRCSVTGITLEVAGVHNAETLARREGVAHRTRFLEGDLIRTPLQSGSFDVAMMECVLSILQEKALALDAAYKVVRPGGYLVLSDVTLSGSDTPALGTLLSTVGCIGGALSMEGYVSQVEAAGFRVEVVQDLPDVAATFLADLAKALLAAEIMARATVLGVHSDVLGTARDMVETAQDMVDRGMLSYGAIVARR